MNNIDGRELLNLTKECLADDLKIGKINERLYRTVYFRLQKRNATWYLGNLRPPCKCNLKKMF